MDNGVPCSRNLCKPAAFPDLRNIPMTALSQVSRDIISKFMNRRNDIIGIFGGLCDWRGFAARCGFHPDSIENLTRNPSPMGDVLNACAASFTSNGISIKDLLDVFLELNRYDLLHDLETCRCVEADARVFQEQLDALKRARDLNVPPQVNEVSRGPGWANSSSANDILTIDDVATHCVTYYDAYILFCDEVNDQGAKFAKMMSKKLEPYVKLFIPQRDLISGAGYHAQVTCEIIEKRCKRLVIILTAGYKKSNECEFQTNYAHCLAPGATDKKLLPVRIEECDTPKILRPITNINYCRLDTREWFWPRLLRSIESPIYLSDDDNHLVGDIHLVSPLQIPMSSIKTGMDYRTFFNSDDLPSVPNMLLDPLEKDSEVCQQCPG